MKLSEEIMVPAAEGNEAVHGKKGMFVAGQYHDNATKGARAIMKLVRAKFNEVHLGIWKSLPMAGQVANSPAIDQVLSFQWLKRAKVGRTVFRNCIAAQEGALNAAELFRKGQTEADVKCRRCHAARESVQHILSGCPVYRTGLMLERHNNVVNSLHATFSRRFGLPRIAPNQPVPAVMENDSAKIYYDVRLFTRNVRATLQGDDNATRYEGLRHDRPDLVVFDKTTGKIHIVEVCVAWYDNLVNQENIKYHKYATNSEVEDVQVLANPKTRTHGYNVRALMGELYGKEFKAGVSVTPIVIGTCGEVLPNIIERMGELNIKGKSALELLDKMQLGAIHGSDRLIRAHLSLSR
uniref:Reverse transcriptase n=1 Tax=Meloidogyne floridensis TaxID=298350 RepID=A0A915NH76_9BILA